jgi:Protein of unknown function (DUF3089)
MEGRRFRPALLAVSVAALLIAAALPTGAHAATTWLCKPGASPESLRRQPADDRKIDPFPAARRRLVTAILLGGNVTVKQGSDVGGVFRHVRACHSARQTSCVIAFSTFNETPPDDAIFGKPPGILTQAFNLPEPPNLRVLCTNPASLRGGSAHSTPWSRPRPSPARSASASRSCQRLAADCPDAVGDAQRSLHRRLRAQPQRHQRADHLAGGLTTSAPRRRRT